MDKEERKAFQEWAEKNRMQKWTCPICGIEYPLFFQTLHLDFIHGVNHMLPWTEEKNDNPSAR